MPAVGCNTLYLQRVQLAAFDEGNRGYLQVQQLHRYLEAVVPTAPMLQSMEVCKGRLTYKIGCSLVALPSA